MAPSGVHSRKIMMAQM